MRFLLSACCATLRGWAPLRNQDAFYEAFDVRAGDSMYIPPEKRVTVW